MKLKEKQAMRLEVMREHLYRVCFTQKTCGEDCPVFAECEAYYRELNEGEEMNETKAYESFGLFINAFKYMDDNWRRCVLQYLTVVNKQLLEEENGD